MHERCDTRAPRRHSGIRAVAAAAALVPVLACTTGAPRGFGAPGLAIEREASSRTEEELGVTAWRVALVGPKSLDVQAWGEDGALVARATVVLSGSSWTADLTGSFDGVVEIARSGEVLQESLDDLALLEHCSDDLRTGFRDAPDPGRAACDGGGADGACGATMHDRCIHALLDGMVGCAGAAGAAGGQSPGDDPGRPGDAETGAGGGETGHGSEAGGGSEGGGSEGGGSDGGGSSGGESGGYDTGGWGESGGYDTGGWGDSGGWGSSG